MFPSVVAPPLAPPSSLVDIVPPGVVNPDAVRKLLSRAREVGYVIRVYRCNSSAECNAVLEAARQSQSAPIILRTTYATSVNYAGKSIAFKDPKNPGNNAMAAVSGAISMALHVRAMAPHYGVPVILQSETQCQYQLTSWYERLYAANEAFFSHHQEPLFSSHRLDLTMDNANIASEDEILAIACKYLEQLDRLKIWLDLPLSSSSWPKKEKGQEEDQIFFGCDKQDGVIIPLRFSTAYKALSLVGNRFSVFQVSTDNTGLISRSPVPSTHVSNEQQALSSAQ